MIISQLLREPRLRNVDMDSADRIAVHRAILESKPLMRDVCRETYALCASLDRKLLSGQGARIELGAGVSMMRDFFPDVVITDVVPATHLDLVLDAQDMHDVKDHSVRAFFGIHCFHHLPDPDRFLSELGRTLVPGGGCILVEPYFGALARCIYPRLFATEGFDMRQPTWTQSAAGSMSNANQALSYVVFFRDRERFELKHPQLRVIFHDQLTNYCRYMLSGGLNFRSIVPGSFAPAVRFIEAAISPIRRLLALHHVVVIQRLPIDPAKEP
jgi:hypothetical protein